MTWLGDFPEDFATVTCMFSTHDGNGAPVAPLTAFENSDVKIYKNGVNTEKTSQNGVTMTSPFDSITGLHCLVIDTSNDTGDSGFWTTGGGGLYTLVLSPDTETVNSQTVLRVIGQFGIKLDPANVAAVKTDTAAVKVQTDKLAFTVANQVDANVLDWKSATAPAMTGDAFARIGAPAGASVSADIAAAKVDTAAIKSKTDSLTFTVASVVDANIQRVNDVTVNGTGAVGNEWGP